MYTSQSPSPPRAPLTPIRIATNSDLNSDGGDEIILESVIESEALNSEIENSENSPPRKALSLQSLFGYEVHQDYIDFRVSICLD